jgi:hypothetical protein
MKVIETLLRIILSLKSNRRSRGCIPPQVNINSKLYRNSPAAVLMFLATPLAAARPLLPADLYSTALLSSTDSGNFQEYFFYFS